MAIFRLSRLAEADLLNIGSYTAENWGTDRAAQYLDELEVCFQLLADHPGIGRSCDHVRPGLQRMEYGSHVVFFRQDAKSILISRILHQRMTLGLRSFD